MFDCCMVNDELDILDIRLNVLDSVVEKFVVVESNRTHAGKEKPLHVLENMDRFKKFAPKLIHLVYDSDIAVGAEYEAWANENRQRDKVLDALKVAVPSDGLLCVCDVDEIPDPQKLLDAKYVAEHTNLPVALEMVWCMYYLNYANPMAPAFRGGFVYNPSLAQSVHASFGQTDFSPTMFRWHMCAKGHEMDFPVIANAGWHFSYMGGIASMRNKLQSLAHIGMSDSCYSEVDHMMKCMVQGRDLFGGLVSGLTRQELTFLPAYVAENKERFDRYLL